MSYFVVVYGRREGRLLIDPERFPDEERSAALSRRFELERELKGQPDCEVVVLGGDSIEAIQRTHGRYFRTLHDLLSLPA